MIDFSFLIKLVLLLIWGAVTVWLYVKYEALKIDHDNLLKELKLEQLHSRQLKRWIYNGSKKVKES
jgi:hypothetical protein